MFRVRSGASLWPKQQTHSMTSCVQEILHEGVTKSSRSLVAHPCVGAQHLLFHQSQVPHLSTLNKHSNKLELPGKLASWPRRILSLEADASQVCLSRPLTLHRVDRRIEEERISALSVYLAMGSAYLTSASFPGPSIGFCSLSMVMPREVGG